MVIGWRPRVVATRALEVRPFGGDEVNVKRFSILLFLTAALLAIQVGCASGPAGPTGTASEIADRIIDEAGLQRLAEARSLESDEDKLFFLGSADYPPFADAAVVQAMIRIDPRLLVVIRAADEKDVPQIKTDLEKNIDPNRLICVRFSLDDVVLDSRGDVVFMTINPDAEQRTALAETFKKIE